MKVTLGEHLSFRNGKKSPERTPNGQNLVYGANGVIGRSDESNTEVEAIVIGRVGSYCGSISFAAPGSWVTENSIIASARDLSLSRFLYYALMSIDLRSHSHGSGQPLLNHEILSSLELDLPEPHVRRGIGEVLGALDDKIAANRHVVKTCDELRSRLWKRACTADSNEVSLSSLARFVNGRAFTKGASGTGRVVIRIAELNSGIGASTVWNDIDVADDHVARPGDLLLAWSGSLTAARWYREEAIVNQHIFKVIPDDEADMWAVASAVDSKMADFKEIAKDKATTMGHIRRGDLDEPVRWPAISVEFSALGSSLWSRALSAEMENEILARTRDELLPLLMDGRITVKDAELAVEDVL